MYLEMNPTMQLYNTFRNRWCGAYFQSKGLRVIPTVNWGDENTFDFCFLGIPKGSKVAVSTFMVSEHDNRCDQKDFFLKGYNEMLRRIEPERIICYNTPFPEMEGNIVFVDYELSSWKYQGSLEQNPPLSPYAKYISGRLPLPENCGIIIKQGYVMHDRTEKGSGSAYGGKWRPNPNKPNEVILRGEPNTIQRVFIQNYNIGESKTMPINYDLEEMRFKTISEFKQFIKSGQLCNIAWQGKNYHICTLWMNGDKKILLADMDAEKEWLFKDVDDLLMHQMDEYHLKDIITQVEVWERSV